MPNRARQRGDYFERRTRAALEADGWLVVRSAGSLGVADLVALRKDQQPRLISCKLDGRLRPAERTLLIETAAEVGAFGVLAYPVRPGWVGLRVMTQQWVMDMPHLHMPAQRRKARDKGPGDGLMPAGEQLTLPFG
jgi:Holliday junction resolvase